MRGDEVPLITDNARNVYFEAENVDRDGISPTQRQTSTEAAATLGRLRKICHSVMRSV
jgi:hypothetical protein